MLFCFQTWAVLELGSTRVPAPDGIKPANGRVISDAWWMGQGRTGGVDILLQKLSRGLLACDTLEIEQAIREIQFWLSWFEANKSSPVPGSLIPLPDIEASIETLYFDGPAVEDWPALWVPQM